MTQEVIAQKLFAAFGNLAIAACLAPLAGAQTPEVKTASCILGFAPAPSAPHACAPVVMFRAQPDPSISDLRANLPKLGLRLASASELSNLPLPLEMSGKVGMLDDGSFAWVIAQPGMTQDNPKMTFAIIKAADLQQKKDGYFAVVNIPLDRAAFTPTRAAQTPAPIPTQNRDVVVATPISASPSATQVSPTTATASVPVQTLFPSGTSAKCSGMGSWMVDGWSGEAAPLLQDAASRYFLKKGVQNSTDTLMNLVVDLHYDGATAGAFAPFVLSVAWDALVAPNPNAAQQYLRSRLEQYVPCDQASVAAATLVDWKNFTAQQDSVSYEPSTLGVLLNTGPKLANFVPRPNPLYLGQKGRAAATLLYQPMVVQNFPLMDDKAHIAQFGTDMSAAALRIGVGSPNSTTSSLTLPIGANIVAQSVNVAHVIVESSAVVPPFPDAVYQTLQKLYTDQGLTSEQAKVKIDQKIKQAAAAQQSAALAARQTATATGPTGLDNDPAAPKGPVAPDQIVGYAADASHSIQLGLFLAGNIATDASALADAVPVVGIVIMACEILGETIANFITTSNYDSQLKKAASTAVPLQLSTYLADQNSSKKILLFTELVKMLVFDPVDEGSLTIDLPALTCLPGSQRDPATLSCQKSVLFQSLPNATLAQARAYANQQFWDVASASQVQAAWNSFKQPRIEGAGLVADGSSVVTNQAVGFLNLSQIVPGHPVPAVTPSGFFYTIRTVEFHAMGGLDIQQATLLAGNYGGRLATADEVRHSWATQGLDAYAYGRLADGTFAVPVQSDHPNFRKGPNVGVTGGNQGFLFVRLYPRALVDADRYYRGQTALACAAGQVLDAGLCYAPCRAGYGGVATLCYAACPGGFHDDGLYCSKPAPYGRGAGYAWQIGDPLLPDYSGPRKRCEKDNGVGNCEQWGALMYPKCKAGFHNVASNVCSPDCPATWEDIGVSCKKPSYDRGIGQPLTTCQPGFEQQGALCYPLCKLGFNGVLDWCYAQ